jgi:hypothetical protein
MSWPNPPYPFGNATSPEPMSSLDTMFNQVGAMISIPCTASGTNAISLTPNVNCPALTSYNELGGYRAVAVNTSSGPVTLQYNGLGFLPVYHADGVTQAATADIQIGVQYIFTFHQALNGGLGGFYFESPSQPVAPSSWFTPGGRLTLQSAVPVMFSNQLAQQTIFYAPYQHAFCPIYNGANVQMYQFTSSLADQVGLSLALAGSASWPTTTAFDVFLTLNGGVPVLATLAWTNPTTRALGLSVFAGFLTNSGSTTMRISAVSTIPVAANQATFIGSFITTANGQTGWQFPGTGQNGGFNISNYYNTVLFTGFVQDNGAAYTYTSNTTRQARASGINQITLMLTSSERAMSFNYENFCSPTAVTGAQCVTGLGIDSTTAFATFGAVSNDAALAANIKYSNVSIDLSATGFHNISANEQGDGTHANTFDSQSSNQLSFKAWL